MARNEKTPTRKTGVAGWNEDAGVSRRSKSEADRKRRIVTLAILAVLCIACAVYAWPIGAKITRGLWLKGGVAVTEVATTDEGDTPSAQQIGDACKLIEKRVNAAGISEVATRQEGEDHVVVDLPWNVDADTLAKFLCGQGKLEFICMDEISDADALAKLNAGSQYVTVDADTYTSFLDNAHIKSAGVTEVSSGVYALSFAFDDEGTQIFADTTRELAEESGSMAIAVDGTIVAAASVSEEIEGGQVSISGNYTAEEANAIKAAATSEPASIRLSLEKTEDVDALLGKTGVWGMAIAALVVFVGVSVVSFVRYKRLAVLTSGTMAVFALVLLGLMAVASGVQMLTLTLPGVAGALLAAAITIVASWRITDDFHYRVSSGGSSVRGAALSCVESALGPLAAPAGVISVASIVFLFLPMAAVREFGQLFVFGVVAGIIAVFWYAVTMLRLLAMGTIQANPEVWGVASAATREGSARGEATS